MVAVVVVVVVALASLARLGPPRRRSAMWARARRADKGQRQHTSLLSRSPSSTRHPTRPATWVEQRAGRRNRVPHVVVVWLHRCWHAPSDAARARRPPDPSVRNFNASWKPWCQTQEFSLLKHREPKLAAEVLTITACVICRVYWPRRPRWLKRGCPRPRAYGGVGPRCLRMPLACPGPRRRELVPDGRPARGRRVTHAVGGGEGGAGRGAWCSGPREEHRMLPCQQFEPSTTMGRPPRPVAVAVANPHARNHGPARPTASTAGSANHDTTASARRPGCLLKSPWASRSLVRSPAIRNCGGP
jgi:hypothetical protein